MCYEFPDDEVETPFVQLVPPDPSPKCRKVAPRSVKGLGSLADMLPGMEREGLILYGRPDKGKSIQSQTNEV